MRLFIDTPNLALGTKRFSLHSVLGQGFKRTLDMLGAALLLLGLAPLCFFVAVAIALDSSGPVFFRQKRMGKNGKPFYMLKFRSMVHHAEKESGAVWAQKNDPRITRVGAFLRSRHLDEIPQLYNVLLGHMSLVGPRPERPEFFIPLTRCIPRYSQRHAVKPGLTGLAQICYPYGASIYDAQEKLYYDLQYIQQHSWRLEWFIMWRTLGMVCRSGTSGMRIVQKK